MLHILTPPEWADTKMNYETVSRNSRLVKIILMVLPTVLGQLFGPGVGLLEAASTKLAWDAPSDYTDGTPMEEGMEYKLHYGLATRSYSAHIPAGTNTVAEAQGLADGQTYYFAVTAISINGVESAYSEEIVWQAPAGPYGGIPHSVPGTVEAEDFDEAGEGEAYHDTTPDNEGGSAYRAGHGVDINDKSTAGNGRCIIAARVGEWLEYTVNIATAGFYTVGAKVAMSGVGGVFHVEVGEADVSGPLQVPDTGGWYTWRLVAKPDVMLSAGEHRIRLALDAAGSGGSVGVFDSLVFTYQSPPGPKTLQVRSTSTEDVEIGVTPVDESGLSDGTAPFGLIYGHGTTVTLTAPAEAGGEPFAGWSGADYAAGTTATLVLDVDKTVTAKYGEDQDPFGGTACTLPGTIQVEDFDEGANGEAYYDTTAANEGGVYRDDAVDIKARSSAQNGYCVTAARAGEWLEYTVNVTTTTLYTVGARVAMRGSGGNFHLEVDGLDVTGPVQVPNTGGWYTWRVIEERDVLLLAGRHVIRLSLDTAGTGGTVGVFDSLQFSAQSFLDSGSTPLVVQAEDFDEGGEGVGYHDTTAANEGRKYRTEESVDIYRKSSAQNGHCVAGTRAGEWLAYTIDVPEAARLALTIRLGMKGDGGTFHLESEGVDVSGPMHVPNTGNWFNWQSVENTNVVLNAGRQVLRLVMDANGPGGAVGVFDSLFLTFLEPLIQGRPGDPPVDPVTGSYIPMDVLVSSVETPYTNVWDMIDGDIETKWGGATAAGGWWTALVYEQDVPVSEVEVVWDETSPTNRVALASVDAENWFDLQDALDATTNAVPVGYLWLIMPDDGSGTAPVVNELFVR